MLSLHGSAAGLAAEIMFLLGATERGDLLASMSLVISNCWLGVLAEVVSPPLHVAPRTGFPASSVVPCEVGGWEIGGVVAHIV